MSTFNTEELEELRSTVRAMLDQRSDPRSVRQWLAQDPPEAPASLWREMADLGWPSLMVPEQYGGLGAGLSPAAIVLEELGAHSTPSPFLSSAVLATWAITNGSTEPARRQWLPMLAGGTAIGTVAFRQTSGAGVKPVEVSQQPNGSIVFRGEVPYVLDAAAADFIIVSGTIVGTGEVIVAVVATDSPGVIVTVASNVDRTRPLAHLVLEAVEVPPDSVLSRGGDAARYLDAITDVGAVALAADGLGAAKQALNMSVEYAKERKQFGRVIGSFQAIKHKLADMYLLVQASDAAVAGAATALDRDPATARRRVASAGSFCRSAAGRVVGDAMQVHGGIGFTWEHDCHILLKRAKFDEIYLTDLWEQYDRLVDALATN